jgi:hypothetical protein
LHKISNLQINKDHIHEFKGLASPKSCKGLKKWESITWQTNKIRSALENVHIEETTAHVLGTVLNV